MIDTTTVNYAISKLTAGWAAAAPHLQDVSEKYVRFIVTQAVITAATCLIVLLIGLVLTPLAFRRVKSWEEGGWGFSNVLAITGVIVILIGLGISINSGYRAAIAVMNPEMFTIQQAIESAKGN